MAFDRGSSILRALAFQGDAIISATNDGSATYRYEPPPDALHVPVVVFNVSYIAFKAESMKTLSAKPETVKRDWYVVDAAGKTLGRLSTEIARRLRVFR